MKEVDDFIKKMDGLLDVNDVSVVVDMGAHDLGTPSRLSAVFPNADVYAFECSPVNLKVCREKIIHWPRVRLIPMGVLDKDGFETFLLTDPEKTRTTHPNGNTGAASFFKANPNYPPETYVQIEVTVPVTRFDTWARYNHIRHVDVLWMDIQGAELLALKGMGDLLSTVRVVHLEVSYQPVYNEQPLFPEMKSYLESRGFLKMATVYSDTWQGNVIFSK